MRALFVGGTGIISAACARLALEKGWEVTVLNRGNRSEIPGTRMITSDINELDTVKSAISHESWDAVVDFTVFETDQIERRIELFDGKADQYVFISSASAYQKPVRDYLITESTPLLNPFWEYSRNKAACEERLLRAVRDRGFPGVIVRPSLTYGDTQIPLAMNSWQKPFTAIDRMRKGKPLIVPGDGTSIWTITHNTDFAKGLVGLMGNEAAVGHAVHITSDEALTWDQIYLATAKAAGVERPKIVHIASDFIVGCLPRMEGTLVGDKSVSAVFDNAKIKRFVPGFSATTRFANGIRRTLETFDATPELQGIDREADAEYDLLIDTYTAGLTAAKAAFASR